MFQSKSFVIITGASKGYGRALACSLAREFSQNDVGKESVIVLVARSLEGLEGTKQAVAKISSDLNVHVLPGDLADLKNIEDLTSSIFGKVDPREFTSAILINNAGSLGDKIKEITTHDNVDKIRQHMDLNITSSIYLTSRFMKHFSAAKNYVIQISTLCAIQATPSLSLYCAAKAAMDMFHQVLALESKETRVLNYAPGPMKTEMYEEIMNNTDCEELKKMFVEMKVQEKVLDPATSADKLVVLLKQDRYNSGAHIDYFDELPQ